MWVASAMGRQGSDFETKLCNVRRRDYSGLPNHFRNCMGGFMKPTTAFILKFMLLLCSTAMAAGQIALAGENKALKAELENQLSGKTVVSKIVFGGRAVPPGYQGDYPVNTLVYPETGAVTYRVEWGVMRADV